MSSQALSSVFHAELMQVLQTYEAVIGIEVHCQLMTHSKLFCSAPVGGGDGQDAGVNSNIDPLSLALPGSLPVLNREAVRLALRLGHALGSDLARESVFCRKNYFYPDLPKGYQITQYDRPICRGGQVTLQNGRVVRLNRMQLEEDAGKSLHEGESSFIDFNRAGVPLVEIVSEPDLRSPAEVKEFVSKLHREAVFVEASLGDLEKGHFRADANVSLRQRGEEALGTRTELKNLNSFRFLERAVSLEILRQAEILRKGGTIVLETRGFDEKRDQTFPLRSKEEAVDYRYFPDPDLPILELPDAMLKEVEESAFPSAEDVLTSLQGEYGLNEQEAEAVGRTKSTFALFFRLVSEVQVAKPKAIGSFLNDRILGMNTDFAVWRDRHASWLAQALDAVATDKVSLKVLRDHYLEALESGKTFVSWCENADLLLDSSSDDLLHLLQDLFAEFPEQAESFRAGQSKLAAFFVGQAMKRTGGRANPKTLAHLLMEMKERVEKF